jgi:GT2 family glycosyltransferase
VSAPLGAVVIGRNEGERLVRCLESLRGQAHALVYVDSGSTDGSPERAHAIGAEVVALDATKPFTAARGRNAGLEHLLERHPALPFVQFVDGDCEVQPGWIEEARAFLEAHPKVGAACGRRRERHPEASPWNRLADLEWDTPVGEAEECGGDAMMRVEALRGVGGYDARLIAGEEPELCLRLRRAGWRIVRLDREMTLHDAALDRFGQWWRRAARSGHAYAECAYLHGRGPERFRVRETASILVWGLALPMLALLGTPWTRGASLLLLGGWGLLWWRVRRHRLGDGASPRDARLFATATVAGKLAQSEGVLRFVWNRLVRRRGSEILEYKAPGRESVP